jgi:hypothetical protein
VANSLLHLFGGLAELENPQKNVVGNQKKYLTKSTRYDIIKTMKER